MSDVGTCRVRRIDHFLEPPELLIERADDVVHFADELVEAIRNGEAAPLATWGDGIVTIHGSNRTVSYGLREYDLWRNVWLAHKSPEVEPIDE